MKSAKSRVTIHMAASLDGFIARKDRSVDWLETSDNFEGGETLAQESIEEFLSTIDCYVMDKLFAREFRERRACPCFLQCPWLRQ